MALFQLYWYSYVFSSPIHVKLFDMFAESERDLTRSFSGDTCVVEHVTRKVETVLEKENS